MTLDKPFFDSVIRHEHDRELNEKIEFLASVPGFGDLERAKLRRFSYFLKPCVYGRGELLLREGDVPTELIFIRTGECHIVSEVGGAERRAAAAREKAAETAKRRRQGLGAKQPSAADKAVPEQRKPLSLTASMNMLAISPRGHGQNSPRRHTARVRLPQDAKAASARQIQVATIHGGQVAGLQSVLKNAAKRPGQAARASAPGAEGAAVHETSVLAKTGVTGFKIQVPDFWKRVDSDVLRKLERNSASSSEWHLRRVASEMAPVALTGLDAPRVRVPLSGAKPKVVVPPIVPPSMPGSPLRRKLSMIATSPSMSPTKGRPSPRRRTSAPPASRPAPSVRSPTMRNPHAPTVVLHRHSRAAQHRRVLSPMYRDLVE